MNDIPRENVCIAETVSNKIGPFPEDFYLLSKTECNVQWSFDRLWSCSEYELCKDTQSLSKKC